MQSPVAWMEDGGPGGGTHAQMPRAAAGPPPGCAGTTLDSPGGPLRTAPGFCADFRAARAPGQTGAPDHPEGSGARPAKVPRPPRRPTGGGACTGRLAQCQEARLATACLQPPGMQLSTPRVLPTSVVGWTSVVISTLFHHPLHRMMPDDDPGAYQGGSYSLGVRRVSE